MNSSRKQAGHQLIVDLTPMIDVVFLLIIFFMVTSHIGDLQRTEVDLPRQEGQEEVGTQEPGMIIDIGPGGEYMVGSIAVDLNEIFRLASAGIAIEADAANFDVLIRPDRNAPAEHLDRLLNKLAGVGVSRWKLGTLTPDGSGGG